MDRRKFLKISGGIAGAGTIAGCSGDGGSGSGSGGDGSGGSGGGDGGSGSDGGTDSSGSKEPIHIGGFEPLSGPFTPWGKAHVSGMEFALKEVNGNGGVLGGRQLNYIAEDSKSNPSEADSIFRRLVEQEDVVIATGAVSSDVGVRTAQTAEDLGVGNMLHMAGSNSVITPDTTHTFRVGLHPATNIARAMSRLQQERGYSKIGAIVADYAWGRSFQSAIKETFGVDVHIEVAPVGASDFKSTLRRFEKDVEMFMATGHPPGQITIMKQLNTLGFNPDFIGGSGFPIGVVVNALGDLVTEGFAPYHMHAVDSDAFVETATAYAKDTGMYFGPNHVYGYVTGKVIAEAIENAGSAEPEAITDALKSNTYDTLYPQALQWTDHGEFKQQALPFTRVALEPPEYLPDGKFHLDSFFTTDPLPAIPPEK